MKSKIAFFLMNEKGFKVLSQLVENNKKVTEVVSARDKNLINDYYEEIQILCKSNNIPFFDKNDNYEGLISADYIITIGWRWLIKGKLQDKLIVSHDSILPKYRGFAPLVNMLINGEEKIGVTFLFGSDNYDCGNIILQKTIQINYPIKIKCAIEIISKLFIESIMELYSIIENGFKLTSVEQKETDATYSLWRNENDYLIDFNKSAIEIRRFIDSLGKPYLGASVFIDDKKFRILDVEVVDDIIIENRDVGKVIFVRNNKPVIVCSEGLLLINEIIDDETRNSVLPLSSFRIKFKGR